jgi:hypothetical protein
MFAKKVLERYALRVFTQPALANQVIRLILGHTSRIDDRPQLRLRFSSLALCYDFRISLYRELN